MPKEIEEEIKEAEIKKEEISKEMDINQINERAETINNIKIRVYNKNYDISELVKITDKKKKTYEEVEISKKFKELIKNYYEGIAWALLRICCGKKYTINDLKRKLTEAESYNIIDIRCSRNNIRFNKNTVDTVIKLTERYNLDT